MISGNEKATVGFASISIGDDYSILNLCHLRGLRLIAALLALLGGCLLNAHAQMQEPFQLVKPLGNDQLHDATPDQSKRLEHLRQLPTTRSVQLVSIDTNALSGNSMAISLPNLAALKFLKTGGETKDTKNFTWSGTLAEEQHGGTTLVVSNGEITGSISSPAGLYRISPLGNGVHAVVEVDSAKFPHDEPESFRLKEKSPIKFDASTSKPAIAKKADSGPTQIDVLVAYTPAAKAGVSDIGATITLAVAEANQSYVNSAVNIHLNLVDSFQVSYSEVGKSFDNILSDFVGMSDVNKRRDQSGADLVALIIDKSDYCGLADAILANASTAFAIVYYDCATGYYSFAHELGHLMGARHNEQADPTNTPFAYGHGYRHDAPLSWRTIMSYDCPTHCQRLQYWSNPRINYGTEPMGTAATNDNARVLNATAATVAAFRTRPSH